MSNSYKGFLPDPPTHIPGMLEMPSPPTFTPIPHDNIDRILIRAAIDFCRRAKDADVKYELVAEYKKYEEVMRKQNSRADSDGLCKLAVTSFLKKRTVSSGGKYGKKKSHMKTRKNRKM